ncbi:MAG: nitrate ABC transporter, permease protein, partial [Burkholderiales bacterium]|nr:nitrate ABC transporter, permease protein [Burkholderiales bacterium]
MLSSGRLAAALLSFLLFALFVAGWHVATHPAAGGPAADSEYAKLLGSAAASGQKSAMPSPQDVARKLWEHAKDPFYVRGTNDQGIGIQISYSIGRVLLGFGLAALVAIPLGFLIGMSPLLYRAFDPFIQVLKPISPLA